MFFYLLTLFTLKKQLTTILIPLRNNPLVRQTKTKSAYFLLKNLNYQKVEYDTLLTIKHIRIVTLKK